MDWQTFAGALGGSALIATVAALVVKRTLEKAIDLRFERLREEQKVVIEEKGRQQAFLFDAQYEALKVALSHAYRARNALRDIVALQGKGTSEAVLEIISDFRQSTRTLQEVLFSDRIALPDQVFQAAHDLKRLLLGIDADLYGLQVSIAKGSTSQKSRTLVARLGHSYDELSALYENLLEISQAQVNVSDPLKPQKAQKKRITPRSSGRNP